MSLKQLTGEMVCFLALAIGSTLQGSKEPEPGLTFKGTIVEVVDGDTVTAEAKVRLRIRLLCWAPETRTTDLAEKAKGIASKEHLKDFALGKQATFHATFKDARRLDDVMTLDRLLADAWVEGQSLSDLQIKKGYATKEKSQ